ncbi:MAG: hypothetical protein K2K60_01475 [Clostridia bacterium]|nr:hypothetical protein [Clostridia bacterium]
MIKSIKHLKLLKIAVLFFTAILSITTLFSCSLNTYASTAVYSNVLDDLQKDGEFNASDYPEIADDYSLQVFQIAESTKGELFIYVYQPAALTRRLTATQINMSLTENFDEYDYGDNISAGDSGNGSDISHGGGGGSFRSVPSTNLYDLTLLNRAGVFSKYKVTNFTVSADSVRYYNITTIYRNYDKDIDTGSTEASSIEEKAFEVGKLFKAETVDGFVKYSCEKRDVVTVTDIFFDFLRYKNGVSGFGFAIKENTDSHYVAFSTDWNMSDLYDVDISFEFQLYEAYDTGAVFGKGTPEIKTLKVDKQDIGDNTPSGWHKSKYYSWNRIQAANDFINDKNNNLTDEARNSVKGKQWVLRYYETDYAEKYLALGVTPYETIYTKVTSVTLLRFHFKSEGIVYNLGAVSDKGHSDDNPGNKPSKKTLWDYFITFCKWLEKVTGLSYIAWAIIFFAVPIGAVLGVLSIFVPVVRFVLGICFKGIWIGIKYLFKGLWIGIKYLFIGLWWLICLPFRGIKALINKIRGE